VARHLSCFLNKVLMEKSKVVIDLGSDAAGAKTVELNGFMGHDVWYFCRDGRMIRSVEWASLEYDLISKLVEKLLENKHDSEIRS